MVTEPDVLLDKLAQRLGYAGLRDFSRIQLRTLIEKKITYYQSRVDLYETKYGMPFEEFRRRVVDKSDAVLSTYGILEKEDDDMEWETALEMVHGYQLDLDELR